MEKKEASRIKSLSLNKPKCPDLRRNAIRASAKIADTTSIVNFIRLHALDTAGYSIADQTTIFGGFDIAGSGKVFEEVGIFSSEAYPANIRKK